MSTGIITLTALALVAALFVTWLVRGYLRTRGDRLVTCPETQAPAGVRVDAGHAAVTGLMGHTEVRLSDCSRWPERQACGQECLAQIAAAPDGCLVRRLVARWYEGKRCALCQRPVGELEWMEHEPALTDLRDPAHRTRAWRDVEPAAILDTLATHAPVCWNCHVTETFRREHPELVIDRPSPEAAPSGAARR